MAADDTHKAALAKTGFRKATLEAAGVRAEHKAEPAPESAPKAIKGLFQKATLTRLHQALRERLIVRCDYSNPLFHG